MSLVTSKWPLSRSYGERYRVEDLVPTSRPLKAVFIGESPHRDEVASPNSDDRSPFRGVAGREWWGELSKFMAEPFTERAVAPRDQLLTACDELKIAVMNAVQYPLDQKITLHEGQASDPFTGLGFQKGAGPRSYKKVHGSGRAVQAAIDSLAQRLRSIESPGLRVVCLGHDSRWFVDRALETLPEQSPLRARSPETVPHPSSWWRNRAYRARAVALLGELLGSSKGQKTA